MVSFSFDWLTGWLAGWLAGWYQEGFGFLSFVIVVEVVVVSSNVI
jgi:hypothetical protein